MSINVSLVDLGGFGVVVVVAAEDVGPAVLRFRAHLPPDVPLYNQFHAMLVNIGKDFCRRRPLCGSCPLNGWRNAPPLMAD